MLQTYHAPLSTKAYVSVLLSSYLTSGHSSRFRYLVDDYKALSGMNWKHARVLLTGRTQDSPCDYRLSWGGRASFNCSEVMMASFKLVQLKFAPRTFVSRKFAPERLAPERSALTRLAVERSALYRLALARL